MTSEPVGPPIAPIGGGAICESEEAATEKSLLLAWAVLVVASTLFIVGVRLVYDVPDDLRYRYSTVVFAVLVSAAQLGVVLMIARRGGLREMLALQSPTSWRRAAFTGVAITLGTYVLIVSLPFLQGNQDQGVGAPWDPSRALPFVLNAVVLVVVSPVLEELMFRGLGFKLLERLGQGSAIVLTGLAFGVFHGLLVQLPAFAAVGFGLGYLRSRTHSVYPGILTHALINLIGVALAVTISP